MSGRGMTCLGDCTTLLKPRKAALLDELEIRILTSRASNDVQIRSEQRIVAGAFTALPR